jgi:hypothetical protein
VLSDSSPDTVELDSDTPNTQVTEEEKEQAHHDPAVRVVRSRVLVWEQLQNRFIEDGEPAKTVCRRFCLKIDNLF